MKRLFWIVFLFVFSAYVFGQNRLKIAVISDIHYLSPALAQPGDALLKYEEASGRKITDMHAVLDEAFRQIASENPDIILISGDLTKDGERQSHLDFFGKLAPFLQQGKRVFVIPGNHDVNVPTSQKYEGATTERVPNVSAEEFARIYATCGYAGVIRKDTASLSYVATLSDNVWLLCLDSNRHQEYTTHTISGGKIKSTTLNWAAEILSEAKDKQIKVIGMTHHGVVEHLPYQSTFFSNYLVENWKEIASFLADNGLKNIFTGHFHANDISSLTTAKGNTICDIETGSLGQYPFPVRFATITGDSLQITTRFISSVPSVPKLEEKYRSILEQKTRQLALSKLKSMKIDMPEEAMTALADAITQLNLLHVKGDEVMTDDLRLRIERFAKIMDNADLDAHSFQMDFPPLDNHVTLPL